MLLYKQVRKNVVAKQVKSEKVTYFKWNLSELKVNCFWQQSGIKNIGMNTESIE